MGEHFRVGILESIGHPTDEREDVLDARPTRHLRTPVDVELPVLDAVEPAVALWACGNSATHCSARFLAARLDAVRELVRVGLSVAASPTCLFNSHPKFSTGRNRKRTVAKPQPVENLYATCFQSATLINPKLVGGIPVGNEYGLRQGLDDVLEGAEERRALRIGQGGVLVKNPFHHSLHRIPKLSGMERRDVDVVVVDPAAAGTASGGASRWHRCGRN